ncbi:AIPR family protein [Sulfurospirillum halorespirans]|uniref:Abortive infection phage protein n=1 Tax=Sulfurospirillum halorespirans DSM 13726 TaxID=1193502 RepID=A0A1D7TFV1_9BACT|nr:AIPR family protein [Sulfurospirillum halorespirans]AOO63859.1 abortive infection phage protein [Sulfurospirillum halorespirans DSM 13726]
MNDIEERLNFRSDLLEDSKDEDGFIVQSNLLSQVLPSMLDAKLIDSEDFNDSYFHDQSNGQKLNAYNISNSGERLQLFIIDESTIDETSNTEELLILQKADYDNQFKRVEKLIKKAFNSQLFNSIQDSDKAKVLASKLESLEGFNEIDVIEIFLISLTVAISNQGKTTQPRSIYFQEEKCNRAFKSKEEAKKKEVLILKKLIDLNFLFNVMVSKGYREVLTIDFEKTFNYGLEAIKAAENESFVSYLCVLKADIIADLYRQYSSRLLEKNVRSFLDFRGVNKGIKETIRKEPEKFIAYNNGLTITATDIKTFENKHKLYIASLTDFQIVNGGQTTATIYFSKKDGLDVSKVYVMAKINVAKQTNEKDLEQLIDNISKYSNAQSKVSNVDLKSRNSQLLKIKKLSESILTPKSRKWFFERSKGEFNTLLRKERSNKNKILKDFPSERRFTKEQLGKYYCAWGEEPYLVKKGGERIFRNFIEHLSPDEDNGKKPPTIDRDYYEALIAKVILFKEMELIYGTRNSAIGQIRSAVIPYSLSVLYIYTDTHKNYFNFQKIWKDEGVDENLSVFLWNLMKLVNALIKKYSLSDDLGEYSKRIELWNSIKHCQEIDFFMSEDKNKILMSKYIIQDKRG